MLWLLKTICYKIFVSLPYELATVVDTSTVSGVNVAQLCSLHNGSTIVPIYDWVSFLPHFFKKFPNIKKYHYFQYKSKRTDVMFYKQFSDRTEESFSILH